MKYNSKTKISTIEDVEKFVKFIYEDLEVNFHPDDDFNDVINQETGEKSFSEVEANMYNNLVNECFNVCERENVDLYEIAYNLHPILQD